MVRKVRDKPAHESTIFTDIYSIIAIDTVMVIFVLLMLLSFITNMSVTVINITI